ncbi:hypothetical protein ACP70R_045650 [Stipagrostis hirtigluma subsp. patula]
MASRFVILGFAALVALSLAGVAAGQCDPVARSVDIVQLCASAAAARTVCCGAVMAAVEEGGIPCLCSAAEMPYAITAGLDAGDFLRWYRNCSGSRARPAELEATCFDPQDRDDGVSPDPIPYAVPTPPPPISVPAQPQPQIPPPPSPISLPAPPPPSTGGQPAAPSPAIPWWSEHLKIVIIVSAILILVFGLLACVRCGGPAGEVAASAFNKLSDIPGHITSGGRTATPEGHGAATSAAPSPCASGTRQHTAALPRSTVIYACVNCALTDGASDDEAATHVTKGSMTGAVSQAFPRNKEIVKCSLVSRPEVGREGMPIALRSNHFAVKFAGVDSSLYQYNVSITTEDDKMVSAKSTQRMIIDKLLQASELALKNFAYDGANSLFTVGPLSQNNFLFEISLEEASKRAAACTSGQGSSIQAETHESQQSKTFKVSIRYAGKFDLNSLTSAPGGSESEPAQGALRILDSVVKEQHAKKYNFTDLTGGISGCHVLHSSFHTTIGGLFLNMDVSTTTVVTPGPVIDFLLKNQNIKDINSINWPRAKAILKNIRVCAEFNNKKFKIIGISDLPCHMQRFRMKVHDASNKVQTVDISVKDFFKSMHIELAMPSLPCLDVGKPNRPYYLPLELCHIASLQRYANVLSPEQRAILVEISRQKPQERMRVITDALESNRYDCHPVLSACGMKIKKQLSSFAGRVIPTPTLVVGNSEELMPKKARWNYNSKKLLDPVRIERWAVVNFSAHCDVRWICEQLINCGRTKGIYIGDPYPLVDEDSESRRYSVIERVDRMFERVEPNRFRPQFLLCVLPKRKNCEIYGTWKKKNLHELGIATQCIVPFHKMNDQYFTNVLLKINTKLGGMNFKLALEHHQMIPIVSRIPTLILGMCVSHSSPGRADMPSIAGVVGSRRWPLISQYRASVRTQSPKVEMIDSLFKPLENGGDDGIIRELLLDFYQSSQQRKPAHIIIFRDGVSESQFSQVLNVELNQIKKAYQNFEPQNLPKFTVIVARKNRHTKLFRAKSPDNVPPGTVVDSSIVHPRQYDFYMCAHDGQLGTTRPTHYHVLLDEIGFSADDLQKLMLSLSYVSQRSTTAISVVAPLRYAQLAASQMRQCIEVEAHPGSSSPDSLCRTIPELPKLHGNICSSMFFC